MGVGRGERLAGAQPGRHVGGEPRAVLDAQQLADQDSRAARHALHNRGSALRLARLTPRACPCRSARPCASRGSARRPLDRRQRQPVLDDLGVPEAGLRAPFAVRVGDRREAGRSRSRRRRNGRRYSPRPTRRADPSARGSAASIVSRGPSASSASARRAQACRYSTAPRLAEPAAEASGRRGSAARRRCASASAIRSASVRRTSSCSARPSIGWKPGTIPASAGNAASSACAKLWMVWILRPPGQSSTLANSCRARSQRRRVVGLAERERDPSRARCPCIRTQAASRAPMRLAISAAAALVKVRHRIDSGPRPVQQQAQHARGQDLRLAGARRSRQRGMDVRVGGERLLALELRAAA